MQWRRLHQRVFTQRYRFVLESVRHSHSSNDLGSFGEQPMTTAAALRTLRVFVSSTFQDMLAERDELMTHTWPAGYHREPE